MLVLPLPSVVVFVFTTQINHKYRNFYHFKCISLFPMISLILFDLLIFLAGLYCLCYF